MKRIVKGLALAILIAVPHVVYSGTRSPNKFFTTIENPEGPFAPFWREFKQAVIDGSSEKVASLARFPLRYGQDCLNRDEFLASHRGIFFDQVVRAIQENPHLVQSNNYPGQFYAWIVQYQDGNDGMEEVFEFSRAGDSFKLTRIGHIDAECSPANNSLNPTNPAQGDK